MIRKKHQSSIILSIFGELDLQDHLESRISSVISSINDELDSYLLNVNESDYVGHKTDEAKIDPLEIHESQTYATVSEKLIPARDFPPLYNVRHGKSYKQQVIKYHIPFSGDSSLLRCTPRSRTLWSMDVDIRNTEFSFEIINFNNDAEEINKEKNSYMRSIIQQFENVSSEVQNYNSNVEVRIVQAFQFRKAVVLKNNNLLSSLDVPIKKSDNVSKTFSVPFPEKRKKISIDRPKVSESEFRPEPSLHQSNYLNILQVIHEVGKQFERLPRLYVGKEEEHLRDHFLMPLETNFEGSATGETFNKQGKTDILLRHEGSNVFIAECKFWKGKKVFLNTVSQLLGYLSWRDSKAAVIMFVSNKDFSSVLEITKKVVKEHPNYIKLLDSEDETWFNYIFHLNDDRNRQISMAIMLYHMPS
ncbi:hypothetical protein L3V86_09395 [Thiotrichales bacterium 19S11-10]|nr:hypothetical protein [Thiotrichales bacterium 19S11-10]